jgi:hypothetical protein
MRVEVEPEYGALLVEGQYLDRRRYDYLQRALRDATWLIEEALVSREKVSLAYLGDDPASLLTWIGRRKWRGNNMRYSSIGRKDLKRLPRELWNVVEAAGFTPRLVNSSRTTLTPGGMHLCAVRS